MAQLLSYSSKHIDIVVSFPDMATWRLTRFYGYPERHRCRESWNILRNLSQKSNLP
ncbi:conserved hypothetical protein [Ricinus communis]|uniref:Uncharacterized protein n=1 Tax=Ricinus communis TaxID=3988 RepID=B9SV75_RICCO|nr:conserved hypothetical protein [Ricinus communis]